MTIPPVPPPAPQHGTSSPRSPRQIPKAVIPIIIIAGLFSYAGNRVARLMKASRFRKLFTSPLPPKINVPVELQAEEDPGSSLI